MGIVLGSALMETVNYDGTIHDIKQVGIDYTIEYEYTCMSCHHRWRLSRISRTPLCPKCKKDKLYFISKRSIDEFFPEDSVIQIPQDSELM
jgi:Zn finger protein HypA/HybF involved in hydrogenase expression